MQKKIIIIGIVVFIASLLIGLISSASLSPPFSVVNMSIGSGMFNSSITFNITNSSSFFMLIAKFSQPINVYLFNRSAFDNWSSRVISSNYSNKSLYYAKSLENRGALAIYTNVSNFTLPQQNGISNGNRVYAANNSSNKTGSYIFVFDNVNGNTVNANATSGEVYYLLPIQLNDIQSNPKFSAYLNNISYIGAAMLAGIIAGVGIIIYGILKKPKVKTETSNDVAESEEIKNRNELYKSIGKKKRHTKSISKNNKKVNK